MKKTSDFDAWWCNGGQGIAERKYTEELEKKFTDKKFLNEKVKEFYGESLVDNKDAENNTFWYVMEQMARDSKLHLLNL